MKITDLANVMAPDLPHETVGIRPGEKLHETMITTDDARSTLELEDRYIIQPMFNSWKPQHYLDVGGKPAPEDFHYSSDTNPDWLKKESMAKLLAN
jgi:UDP-N-acetylglucosamine 4,6-dehydratase